MALLKVDREKCDRDARCVETCPMHILALDSDKGPVVREGRARFCIACGHCVAVCPNGALDNTRNPLDRQAALSRWPVLEPDVALEFLKSRRSIRAFKEEPVEREALLSLLDAARWAPSGHNIRVLSYTVVDGPEAVARVRELVVDWMKRMLEAGEEIASRYHFAAMVRAHEKGEDRILRNAPQLIVAHAPGDLPFAEVNTTLALEYVELLAPTLGLGTCWAGFVEICARHEPALALSLGIPEDRVITGIMMVGYPRYDFQRIPYRPPVEVAWLK